MFHQEKCHLRMPRGYRQHQGGPVGVGGERSDVSPAPLMPHPSPPVHVHTVNVGGVGDVSEHDLDCVLVAIP